MMTKTMESFQVWTKPTKAAFDFWVSFWPVAPVFGVEWRFADAMPRFTPRILETKGDEPASETPPVGTRSRKAAKKPADAKPEPEVALVEAVEEAVAPAEAMMEAAIEGVEASFEAATHPRHEETEAKPAQGRPAALLDLAPAEPDDLKLIKGIGPALEKQLNGLGVFTFAQVARFSDADLAWIDDNLTSFKGRCFRDDWVGQAKALLG